LASIPHCRCLSRFSQMTSCRKTGKLPRLRRCLNLRLRRLRARLAGGSKSSLTNWNESVHASSKAHDWRTPEEILKPVRQMAGGTIGLDPCADTNNHTGALSWFDGEAHNGLTKDWLGQGLVYANPPYGRSLIDWAAKFAFEGKSIKDLLTLTPARTDTSWWHDHMITANAICFWKGRVKFIGPDGPMDACPFPVALCYWGHNEMRFGEIFKPYGWIVFSGLNKRITDAR